MVASGATTSCPEPHHKTTVVAAQGGPAVPRTRSAVLLIFLFASLLAAPATSSNECTPFEEEVDGELVSCSGHGSCTAQSKRCICEDGFGSEAEFAMRLQPPLPAPDCSEKVCNFGRSWSDVPTASDTAHALVECSDRGTCDRTVGVCECLPGYAGSACQYTSCKMDSTDESAQDCNGHGQCLTLSELAGKSAAQPLNSVTAYGGFASTTTWDQDKITSCFCDSSWSVGLASGEKQLGEYFGPFCERRRCPSGDDPMTDDDETDCESKRQDPISGAVSVDVSAGAAGNLCHIDCSNRGICNFETGVCKCFAGYSGEACESQDVNSV
mmetsp:Transcript_12606/g.32173  ORF Transcript_12606/g.32173 Transcript_12606/m.32173 type:complete len:326 (+) Transcript_12606:348-1325(+)